MRWPKEAAGLQPDCCGMSDTCSRRSAQSFSASTWRIRMHEMLSVGSENIRCAMRKRNKASLCAGADAKTRTQTEVYAPKPWQGRDERATALQCAHAAPPHARRRGHHGHAYLHFRGVTGHIEDPKEHLTEIQKACKEIKLATQ